MTGEEAVRRYLAYLEDPEGVRDGAAIADLEARLAKAQDPIEKIRLASELYRAEHVDGSEYRRAFVEHAKGWADAQGIVAEAFVRLGVPVEDLRDAGFPVGRSRRSRPARARAARVSVEDLKRAALAMTGPFSAADLRGAAGGTPATVRKAIDALREDGRLVDLGPDRSWTGRGRSPHLYRVS
jgi:hypothetical protein